MILKARGWTPQIGEGSWIAPTANVIGNVTIGRRCSIWFQAVLRGDVMPIVIGDETNIQDGCTVHGTFEKAQAVIGQRVTVGHNVILHGCSVGDRCLIGMGSIIMDNVQVGPGSIVGAGSLLTEGSKFPPGVLVLGRPGKVIRNLHPEEVAFLDRSADNYLNYVEWYSN